MKVIWKFIIAMGEGRVGKRIPCDAKILAVGQQDEQIVLWAEVDPEAMTERREFQICVTGGPTPEGESTYLGTVQFEATAPRIRFVAHVYELH